MKIKSQSACSTRCYTHSTTSNTWQVTLYSSTFKSVLWSKTCSSFITHTHTWAALNHTIPKEKHSQIHQKTPHHNHYCAITSKPKPHNPQTSSPTFLRSVLICTYRVLIYHYQEYYTRDVVQSLCSIYILPQTLNPNPLPFPFLAHPVYIIVL